MSDSKIATMVEHEHDAEASPTDAHLERLETVELESGYHVHMRTYITLIVMGIAWGTCTLGNVGPSTTYTYAVKQLGGATKESWVPNAGLFPLIGLQPIWVSSDNGAKDLNHEKRANICPRGRLQTALVRNGLLLLVAFSA